MIVVEHYNDTTRSVDPVTSGNSTKSEPAPANFGLGADTSQVQEPATRESWLVGLGCGESFEHLIDGIARVRLLIS